MNSGDEDGKGEFGLKDDMLKCSKKEYQGNNIPQPEVSEDGEDVNDVNETVNPDPIQDTDDTEEVCLSRADIKEM